MAGPITGAHFNPAVSLGVYMMQGEYRRDFRIFTITCLAQFLGGIIGICFVWATLYNPLATDPKGITRAGVPVSEFLGLKINKPLVNWFAAF